MYPVSNAFLQAVQENTRKYYWTGKITTKNGVVYNFDADDIVKGSGYISSQCCGSTEIELGTVYASEQGITLFSDIDRYSMEALQNAELNLSIYQDNDIETCRDVLYYIGQLLGGFFFINREGRLELKRYGTQPVLEILQTHRYSSSVSDFVTRYTAVSSTNLVTGYAEYYHLTPDNGLTMNLGANPFLQYGLEATREEICMNILNAISVISYTPFDIEFIGNPALDIGDVIKLSGGQMGTGGTIGCITSRSIKIGGRERLQGVDIKAEFL